MSRLGDPRRFLFSVQSKIALPFAAPVSHKRDDIAWHLTFTGQVTPQVFHHRRFRRHPAKKLAVRLAGRLPQQLTFFHLVQFGSLCFRANIRQAYMRLHAVEQSFSARGPLRLTRQQCTSAKANALISTQSASSGTSINAYTCTGFNCCASCSRMPLIAGNAVSSPINKAWVISAGGSHS